MLQVAAGPLQQLVAEPLQLAGLDGLAGLAPLEQLGGQKELLQLAGLVEPTEMVGQLELLQAGLAEPELVQLLGQLAMAQLAWTGERPVCAEAHPMGPAAPHADEVSPAVVRVKQQHRLEVDVIAQ